jgi:hypothetical protein
MLRTAWAVIAAVVLGVVSFATAALAQGGVPRRIVYPHDPAPTLSDDIAALQTTLGVTIQPGGGQAHSVVGLDTLRLGQALRDAQRGAPGQVNIAAAPSTPPPGGGFTNLSVPASRRS